MYVNNTLAGSYGFFQYKGKKYLYGTIVKFNKNWLKDNGHPLFGKIKNTEYPFDFIPYGECTYGKFTFGNPSTTYNFTRFPNLQSQERAEIYAMLSTKLSPTTIENAIEEIIVPVELIKNPNKEYNQIPEIKIVFFVYILLMLCSFLFTEPWGCWIVFTILFIALTKKIMKCASENDGPWWDD